MHLTGGFRVLDRLAIRVRDHEHGARDGVLRDDSYQAAVAGEVELVSE